MFRKWCALACLCLMTWLPGAASARQISFELQDDKGVVTHESYPGKYLLLSIGFTSCPDICPTTLYEYAGVMQSLKNPDAIQPIFVTIDPLNDDPERLNAYTRFFDERIVAWVATGRRSRRWSISWAPPTGIARMASGWKTPSRVMAIRSTTVR